MPFATSNTRSNVLTGKTSAPRSSSVEKEAQATTKSSPVEQTRNSTLGAVQHSTPSHLYPTTRRVRSFPGRLRPQPALDRLVAVQQARPRRRGRKRRRHFSRPCFSSIWCAPPLRHSKFSFSLFFPSFYHAMLTNQWFILVNDCQFITLFMCVYNSL